MAFLNKGLTISIRDERPDFVNGEAQRGRHTATRAACPTSSSTSTPRRSPLHVSVIDFEEHGEGIAVEIAMQWNNSYSESVYTFANTINTAEGGTHEEGFRAALTSIVNRYAREQKFLKEGKDDNLAGEDVREGLTAIISVKLADPQFEGQTKTKLGNTEAKSFVQKACNDHLRDWFERNPGEAKDIINKSLQASRARMAARQARDLTRRKSLLESAAGCPASWPTASGTTRRSASCSSSRVTRRAARPRAAATPSSRRSSRSAARSSTSRRRGSTRSSRTTRSRR